MIACEAITNLSKSIFHFRRIETNKLVAIVAKITIGQCAHPGTER